MGGDFCDYADDRLMRIKKRQYSQVCPLKCRPILLCVTTVSSLSLSTMYLSLVN